jgi:single-strand DNA-binding protein
VPVRVVSPELQAIPVDLRQPFLLRLHRRTTRGPSARVALRAARAGLGLGVPLGLTPCGARRRFASLLAGCRRDRPGDKIRRPSMTNIVLLVGNLGGDPELRSTNGGIDVASFSLGTSRPKRDSEGRTYKDESGFTAKDTEWHRVTCFNGLGRVVAQHVTKGMLVSVKGRIHNSKWTDKDGVDRYGYEIIADDVQFLGRPKQSSDADDAPDNDGDLPL